MVGGSCQSCRHWRLCVTFTNPVQRTSAAVTSFNLRVVRILSSRACLTAIRIKERLVVVSQSSFIELWKYVEHRGEKKRKEHEWWESCFNSSLCFGAFIAFISYLFLPLFPPLSTSSSAVQPPVGLTSRFHSSLLHSRLFILAFWPLALHHTPVCRFYLCILSAHFPAKISSDIWEVFHPELLNFGWMTRGQSTVDALPVPLYHIPRVNFSFSCPSVSTLSCLFKQIDR